MVILKVTKLMSYFSKQWLSKVYTVQSGVAVMFERYLIQMSYGSSSILKFLYGFPWSVKMNVGIRQ
jgi:hypothetical protein